MKNYQTRLHPSGHPRCHKPRTRVLFCLGALAGAAVMLFGGTAAAQLRLDVAPEYFYWQEEMNGVKLLDESGFRIGLELSYKERQEKGWLMAGRFKAYYGSVNYDGIVLLGDGETTPIKATTDYYGALAEARYGYRSGLGEKHYLDVMGGVGVEFWLRRLGSQYGYDEYWFPIYVKAGAEVCPRGEKGWIAALGIKVPVYTIETVDLGRLGGGTVTLNPGINVSPFAEAGYQFTKNLSAVAFFDSYWFAKSDMEMGAMQPESKTFQAGLKVGWTF